MRFHYAEGRVAVLSARATVNAGRLHSALRTCPVAALASTVWSLACPFWLADEASRVRIVTSATQMWFPRCLVRSCMPGRLFYLVAALYTSPPFGEHNATI